MMRTDLAHHPSQYVSLLKPNILSHARTHARKAEIACESSKPVSNPNHPENLDLRAMTMQLENMIPGS